MYYVLDDGRILSDFNHVGESKYVAVNEYPNPIISGDKIKVCTGIEGNALKWEMFDYEEPKEPEPEPTQLDRIEANTKNLLSSNSALDVLLGVSDVEQNASG